VTQLLAIITNIPLIPAFAHIVTHLATLKTTLIPGILTSLIHRATLSLVILWTTIGLAPLLSSVLVRTAIIGTAWSSSTRPTLTVFPFISHILHLLAFFD
jgi:hypothetical protein